MMYFTIIADTIPLSEVRRLLHIPRMLTDEELAAKRKDVFIRKLPLYKERGEYAVVKCEISHQHTISKKEYVYRIVHIPSGWVLCQCEYRELGTHLKTLLGCSWQTINEEKGVFSMREGKTRLTAKIRYNIEVSEGS